MSTIAVHVDEKLKEEATKLYRELGLDMTTAIKMFLTQSVLTRSIPFDIKLDSDFSLELNSGDYIRTRDIIEYNQETQEAYQDYMKKYQEKGIDPSSESVEEFFSRMVDEHADV
ncbi:type II toxin-antitoxin system RelB/DinJ family antitoxin [Streptococcus sp. DD04]|uniref:type II toxin-antitoxin system RelB/DinJ family antitoxin n=1 Tax=Streptococcus sp. DD04 TaxID=1776578 RepID=UPI00078600FF|nr:type II toxin-antitoxin system RelB/DinJ family antitoxin [Streptococcus sp. DD04]KXT65114.1 putative DNA-damage-inducible protein J [Streptococcus sp. DD04]